MKRLIFALTSSFMLMCIGCATLFFEVKDFRVVNADDPRYYEFTTENITATKENPFVIDANGYDVDIQFDVNEKYQDISIDINENVDYRIKEQTLRVQDIDEFEFHIGGYVEYFLDGLKDNKIYTYHNNNYDYDRIVIHCNAEAKQYIEVKATRNTTINNNTQHDDDWWD